MSTESKSNGSSLANVLTLVADPACGALDDTTVASAREALTGLGAAVGDTDWLAPGTACDIPFAGADPAEAQTRIQAALAGQPIDAVAQVAAGRRKAILVADMESTMIENEMVDELAEVAGVGQSVALITARTMNGELDFAGSLRNRVALLTGLPETALEKVRARIRPSPGARALVATMRRSGGYAILVSGGFSCFAGPVATMLDFDRAIANQLEIERGKINGRVAEPVLDAKAKKRALEDIAQVRGFGTDATMAVGDGANDLEMLCAAGAGVAWRAKPSVAAAAPHRIDHGDLTALLYLQGYRAGEIVG